MPESSAPLNIRTGFRLTCLCLGVLTLGLAAGCQSPLSKPAGEVDISTVDLTLVPQSLYPQQADLGEDLDIVVQRRGRTITLNNRTAIPFESVQLWLNRQYGGQIDRIDIGADNRVDLRDLLNHHGEHFPIGGLLTPDRAFPVVLAEIYDPVLNKRHRLLARDEVRQIRGIGEED